MLIKASQIVCLKQLISLLVITPIPESQTEGHKLLIQVVILIMPCSFCYSQVEVP